MDAQNQQATKAIRTILHTTKDWTIWYMMIKQSYKTSPIWKYVDPDKPRSDLQVLEEPTAPTFRTYSSTPNATTAITEQSLTDNQRLSYHNAYIRYRDEQAKFERTEQIDTQLRQLIFSTISDQNLILVRDKDTTYDILTTLKNHLSPSDHLRRYELQDEYNKLQTAPQSLAQIEQWFNDWAYTADLCISMKVITDETIALRDFIRTCLPLYESYASICQRSIQEKIRANKTSELRLTHFIEDFRQAYREKASISYTANATLQAGGNSKNNSNNNNGNRPRGDQQKPSAQCVCGKWHFYSKCYYLNTSIRPQGWVERANIKAKVDKALQDAEIKARIDRALTKNKQQQKSPKPFDVDADDTQPAKGTTLTINKQQQIDEPAITPPITTITTLPPPAIWTPTVLPPSAEWGDLCLQTTRTHDTAIRDPRIQDQHQTTDQFDHQNVGQSFTVSANAMSTTKDDVNLLDRFILDPGSNIHVVNSTQWVGWVEDPTQDVTKTTISAGCTTYQADAIGTLEIEAQSPSGPQLLRLKGVIYVKGFLTSLMGLARCRTQRLHFDSGRDCLYLDSDPLTPFVNLEYTGGHWLIDSAPERRPTLQSYQTFAARPSRDPLPPQEIDSDMAHLIWGHASRKVINHLPYNVDGLELKTTQSSDQSDICDTCIRAKMTQIISRRPSGDHATKPFYRVHIDVVYIINMADQCWNGDRYAFHAIDEYTKWHHLVTSKDKTKNSIMNWLKGMIHFIQRQMGYPVLAIHMDGERAVIDDLTHITKVLGIRLEVSPPQTHEPNGPIERANGVVGMRARAMIIKAGFPKSLANEAFHMAIYVINRTPTEALNWKTPYELAWGKKPTVAHMRPFGCVAYALDRSVRSVDKVAPRALMGHLVGYQSTNVFRIWLPHRDSVVVSRDVVFDITRFYTGEGSYTPEPQLRQLIHFDNPPIRTSPDISVDDLIFNTRQRQHSPPTTLPHSPPADDLQQPVDQQIPGGWDSSDLLIQDDTSDTLDFEHSPESVRPNRSTQSSAQSEIEQAQRQLTDQARRTTGYPAPGYRLRGSSRAPRDINADVDQAHIIPGARTRGDRRRQQQGDHHDTSFAHCYAVQFGSDKVDGYLKAFTTQLEKHTDDHGGPVPRIHSSQIDPPPKHYGELKGHSYEPEFKQAMYKEWSSLWDKGCFQNTTLTKEADTEIETLPTQWVYTYKFKEDGYLSAFKARLVVRGDLQRPPADDTYAATLAIRAFRALVAIANTFDLEMKQYDVLTAFLNAKLDRELYTTIPRGIRHTKAVILLVCKALYGLRESPRYWLDELTTTLKALGLKPAPGFPGVYTSDRLILFAYVDDIVMAYH